VYSSLPAEVTDVSSGKPDAIAGATVAAVVADSGVSITAEEAEAVARSLVRIEAAAAILLRLPSFDETGEQYYRLLESDAAEGRGA
jgi:hypothetical protein